MVVQVEPVVHDGQHWVNVTIGGSEMQPKGPFPDANAAEAMAKQLRCFGHTLTNGGKRG
jgi:hypothetical protein